jgi:RecG-like helicase
MLQEICCAVKGVGACRADDFGRLSIRTLGDLLYFMPREYQDFSAYARRVAYARRACRAEAAIVQERGFFAVRGWLVAALPGRKQAGCSLYGITALSKLSNSDGKTSEFCGRGGPESGG